MRETSCLDPELLDILAPSHLLLPITQTPPDGAVRCVDSAWLASRVT